jgi:hypothetical protein
MGASAGADGRRTAPQEGRSRRRLAMGSLESFQRPNPTARIQLAWGPLSF